MTRAIIWLVLTLTCGMLTSACGGGGFDRSSFPGVGPTAAGTAAITTVAGAGVPVGSPAATTGRDTRTFGIVANLAGTCPAVTFTLGPRTIKTTSSTSFDGGGCADVISGVRVVARGALQSDGITVIADEVFVPPESVAKPTKGDLAIGSVTGLTGACPVVSFSAGGRTVMTNASTVFEPRSCADLANGNRVDAVGKTQSDGSLLATRVRSAK